MKLLQQVDVGYVHQLWPTIKKHLEVPNDPRVTNNLFDQLKANVISKANYLFVIVENDKIIGALIMHFIITLEHKTLFISAFGGEGVANKEVTAQIENWARSQGATRIQAYAKDSRARLFRMILGLDKVTNLIERIL